MSIVIQELPIYVNIGIETPPPVIIEIAEMGLQGLPGIGVPSGGMAGQVLAKIDSANYNTHWVNDTSLSSIIKNEVPSGLINGINATFTSANNFVSGSLEVFLNGSLQKIIDDYQVIGNNTISFNFSPLSNENLLINYIKV
jgi:hypothetical protein